VSPIAPHQFLAKDQMAYKPGKLSTIKPTLSGDFFFFFQKKKGKHKNSYQ
jgi:hypothetical protein